MERGLKALIGGVVLDYSADETRELTTAQRERVSKSKGSSLAMKANKAKVFPPEPGFVVIRTAGGYAWHRSGSLLFLHQGHTILLGVDEDAYFGVELADKAKTLEQAYESLIPKELRKLNCPRQGEWFAVEQKEGMKRDDPRVLAILGEDCGCAESGLALPIDNPDASLHLVAGTDVFVTKEGIPAHNPYVHHSDDEHADMELRGWYRFVRNTAIRSFSEQGVD
jgi:hypothetical protein